MCYMRAYTPDDPAAYQRPYQLIQMNNITVKYIKINI